MKVKKSAGPENTKKKKFAYDLNYIIKAWKADLSNYFYTSNHHKIVHL